VSKAPVDAADLALAERIWTSASRRHREALVLIALHYQADFYVERAWLQLDEMMRQDMARAVIEFLALMKPGRTREAATNAG
jgi:hypothetical protein